MIVINHHKINNNLSKIYVYLKTLQKHRQKLFDTDTQVSRQIKEMGQRFDKIMTIKQRYHLKIIRKP